jgi:hypothetical protein
MGVETIYVYLLDEGTDAWAPVQAQSLGDGRFRLIGSMPEDQEWQFAPGAVVNVEVLESDGAEYFRAVSISN